MRFMASCTVLGFSALACSSSGNGSMQTGSMQTGAPPPYSASSSMGGSPSPEASGSGAAPASPEPSGAEGDGAGSGSEASGDLPVSGDGTPDPSDEAPDPADDPGEDDPGEDDPEDGEQMPPVVEPPPAQLETVLAFTRTTGFRHDSIEAGFQALQRLGQDNGFGVERTEDPADFNDDRLARYDVVVWLNTDSEVMNEAGRRAFERYIRAGGGWVGVHAAAASEYGWAWYGQLLGGAAYFSGHPAIQPARVNVQIGDHASTQHLPQTFTLQDEWYSFRTNPRSSVQVLMTLDESSYGVGDLAMGDHPIAWYHEFEGGRAWYTALGHPISLYSDPVFTGHLLGGIRWAAGVAP
jgi:cytochrome c